jgi:hypothetical protein
MKRAVLSLFLIVLLTCELAFFLQVPTVSGTDWLTGWTYRKSHLVTNVTGADVNYQVQVTVVNGSSADSGNTVYVDNKIQADFDDVRFTDDDGSTTLDYWRMVLNAGLNATFWVEILDNLTSSNATIYVYYGNSTVTTVSSFDNTFVFGDPFDAALNGSKWTSITGSPSYSVDTTNHYLSVTALSNYGDNGYGFHSKNFTYPAQYIVESAYATTGYVTGFSTALSGNCMPMVMYSTDDSASWSSGAFGVSFTMIRDSWSTRKFVEYAGVGETADYASGQISWVYSYDYLMPARMWKLNGNISCELWTTVQVNEANSATPYLFQLGISAYSSTYKWAPCKFYSFKIRSYCSPEPSHSTWGSEETVSGKAWNHIYFLFNSVTRTWIRLSWSFDLKSREWNRQDWTFDLISRSWQTQSWTFYLITREWSPHQVWTFDLDTREWNSQAWVFDLITRSWTNQDWTFDVNTRAWAHQNWTFDLITRMWQGQQWTFDLISKMWNRQDWTFVLNTIGWNRQFWSFTLVGKLWNFQTWAFELTQFREFSYGLALMLWSFIALFALFFIGVARKKKTASKSANR